MPKKTLKTGDVLPQMRRLIALRADANSIKLDKEARTLELTFSSEHPVDRWFGKEVLSHAPGAAKLGRLNDGAPLLFNHDRDDLLGVVESASVGADRKGHALIRFGKDARGDWAMNHVDDSILRNVSFAYVVNRFESDGDPEEPSDDDTYTATDWEAHEISLVTVPADPTVGVGRSAPGNPEITRSVAVVRRAPVPAAPTAAAAASTQEFTMDWKAIARSRGLKLPDDASEAAIRSAVLKKLKLDDDADDADVTAALERSNQTGADQSREDATRAERDRVIAIEALRAKFKLPRSFAVKAIKEGRTIEEARGLVLDHFSESENRPVADFGHQHVDMTDKEARGYSFQRAVNAIISGDWSQAGFEREVSNTIAKGMKRNPQKMGFFIPSNLPFCPSMNHLRAWRMAGSKMAESLMQRAIYQVGVGAQGGNLVQTVLLAESFIEVLRNLSVTAQLGARMLTGLVGNVDIPRQNAQTQTYWVGESGAPTEAEATFDKVSLRPKTIGALSKMSRLMLLQSTPAIEMLVREDLIAVMALGLDLGALSGSGSANQPTGIVNQAGVGSVVGGTNGANWTFDHFIQLIAAVKIANAPLAALATAMNSRTKGYLSTIKSTTGQYLWSIGSGGVAGGQGTMLQGYPFAESQQLRSTLTKGTSVGNCSEAIFGNWRELLIGEWGVTEITVNPFGQTDFSQGDVAIRAFQTLDVQLRHGASFAVMSDGLTPGF